MSYLETDQVRKSIRTLRDKLKSSGKPLCVCVAGGNEDLIWNMNGLTVLKDISGIDELLNLMEGIVSISNVVVFVTPVYWNIATAEADVAIVPLRHSVKVVKWRNTQFMSPTTMDVNTFVSEYSQYGKD